MLETAVETYEPSAGPAAQTLVKAVVLAGGQGERLLPLTESRPKPLIAFGDGRIVDFTLRNCRNSGFPNGMLLTQHGHEQLASYVRENWEGFNCLPPVSGKRYRGTADAVFQNLPLIAEDGAEHALILSADHVYRMDYRRLLARHLMTGADVTISAMSYPIANDCPFGVLDADQDLRVKNFVEKPRARAAGIGLISMGIYIFRMRTLADTLHRHCDSGFGFDFGRDIIPSLIGSAKVFACEFGETSVHPVYWRDIGTIDSYYQAAMDLTLPNPPIPARETVSWRRAPALASLSGGAHVARTVLAGGVRIEEGAHVEDSVIMPNVHVGKGVSLRRVIVNEGVRIPDGAVVGSVPALDQEKYAVSQGGVAIISGPARTETPRQILARRQTTAPTRPGAPLSSMLKTLWERRDGTGAIVAAPPHTRATVTRAGENRSETAI